MTLWIWQSVQSVFSCRHSSCVKYSANFLWGLHQLIIEGSTSPNACECKTSELKLIWTMNLIGQPQAWAKLTYEAFRWMCVWHEWYHGERTEWGGPLCKQRFPVSRSRTVWGQEERQNGTFLIIAKKLSKEKRRKGWGRDNRREVTAWAEDDRTEHHKVD